VSSELATVEERGAWLVVRFPSPHRTLSWAIVGGGFHTTSTIVWRQVADHELGVDVDPRALLMRGLAAEGLPDAVGLLTGSPVARAVRRTGQADGLTVDCLATVGLGNALRAGDPAVRQPRHPIGTINACVWFSRPLSDEALVEAQALCAEARTVAMLGSGVASIVSALPATGTGTDCQVIAAPARGQPLVFVGKHTAAGHLVGSVVGAAIEAGIARWLEDRLARGRPR
jgi:adenosylcobinamide amidohydrolase